MQPKQEIEPQYEPEIDKDKRRLAIERIHERGGQESMLFLLGDEEEREEAIRKEIAESEQEPHYDSESERLRDIIMKRTE